MEIKQSAPKKKEVPSGVPGRDSLEKVSTYEVDGKRFIVTPVFQKDGRESFGSLLMRLMKADVTDRL